MKGMVKVWLVLIIIGALLVVGGAAGGGYWYYKKTQKEKEKLQKELDDAKKSATSSSATSTDTSKKSSISTDSAHSDWKTYDNAVYGYFFKYPSNYHIVDYVYNTQTGAKEDLGKYVMVDKNAIPENAMVSQSEGPNAYLLFTRIDVPFDYAEMKTAGDLAKTATDVTIDGEMGVKVVYNAPNIMTEEYSSEIAVNHNGKGYHISWKNSDAAGTHDTKIDEIILTFKFK